MNQYFYHGMSVQNKRKQNMDCLLMSQKKLEKKTVYFFVVCDGVGSTHGGGLAATFCSHYLKNWFDHLEFLKEIPNSLEQTVLHMNQELIAYLKVKEREGATTLSLLILTEEKSYLLHVGDSRIYGITGENITILTPDHVDSRGRLVQYIGKEQFSYFYQVGKVDYRRYLLCSDGFYRKMDKTMVQIPLTKLNIQNKIKKMLSYAIDSGEQDNISIIIAQDSTERTI